MNLINDILDILDQVKLYKNSEKGKEDKKLLDDYIKKFGKPIEKNTKVIV